MTGSISTNKGTVTLADAAVINGPPRPLPGGVRLVPCDRLRETLAAEPFPPLAVINYGDQGQANVPAPTVSAQVELPQLGDTPMVEIWTSTGPVSDGTYQEWRYSCNDTLMFGVMELDDSPQQALEEAALEHYEHLFDLIEDQGYPHLLRMWNYFPAMNEEPDGLERYKRFCVGRHQAFDGRFTDYLATLPAASAIGTQSGHKFIMYFIASRQAGHQVENPRQVSAFCYPPQYGPASPSFSRATCSKWRDGEQLFLSGTASVVGHESMHPDDVAAQTRETLDNVAAVSSNARNSLGSKIRDSDLQGIKVYIRRPQDLDVVRDIITRQGLTDGPVMYLQGDICRTELLLEIEGLYSQRA